VNRKFVQQLIRLREARLREQTAGLKQASRGLLDIRQQHEQVRSSAAQSIQTADTIAHLEVLGQARMKLARLAVKAEETVRGMTEQVGQARKLTESAHNAGAELRRAGLAERDRSMETEAEQFFSWSKCSTDD
jgi:hypothetical protein